MAPLVSFLSVCYLLLSAAAFVPSPQSIGSDLSIITHNDLYRDLTTRLASSIVLDTPYNHTTALSKCAALGTTLWNPDSYSQHFTYLQYLDYGKPPDQVTVFWVESNSTCTAISTRGQLKDYPCNTKLPVLCSNTATDGTRQVAVTTNNATIVGRRDQSFSSFRFLGIKYGAIPARFTHSTYHPPPPGSNLTALEYAPKCIQSGCSSQGASDCTEDCLTLNIWTPYLPNTGNTKNKAVMVWMHGGGFTSGTASDTTFDGGAMASRGDVVLVTINYRLSTLGFLALSNTSLAGNYGLADQNVALEWLRAHIGDFGGDKDRITIFGQSAGAAAVRALLASPQAQGKFAGAIMQSTPQGLNYASTFAKYLTIPEATNRTMALVNEVGCAQRIAGELVDCLRRVDALVLVKSNTVARYPVVDGEFLTSPSLPLGPSAPKLSIPVMMGNMHDDGSPYTSYSPSTNVSAILTSQGFNASAILASNAFPLPNIDNSTLAIFNLTTRVATDGLFRCLTESSAYTAAANGIFDQVYSYEFDRAYQIPEWSPNPPACEAPVSPGYPFGNPNLPYYKCHSGDLLSVFGTIISQGRPLRDANDIPFSQYIIDSWTAFARTGNPNPDKAFLAARGFTNTTMTLAAQGNWEPVNAQDPKLRALNVEEKGGMVSFRKGRQCEVLGLGLGYYNV
ncbi:hypothetical protein TW65_00527 [Stemphylium lycopersici]|uniref:Carboxylic ester hydrolase n=1 Tax=Stemphylium lycopersici TaxID=183478 RepID=A0A364N8U5_STELY|nr:hypothetical protein TW65_00527 [Stemphylium lycopersici]RAR13754.1 hypothetical protein DDE83_002939 [Stemphylium lycopersici]